MDEREPKMLRAFTSLEVNPAGQYDLSHIKSAPLSIPLSKDCMHVCSHQAGVDP